MLASDGLLADPDDAFFLTSRQLMLGPPGDVRELVALRRARRAEYQALVLPGDWTGTPVPIEVSTESVDVVTGVAAASGGVVEGRVRVLLSPDFDAVERDEILVAPTTDPSWSSVMFIGCRAGPWDIGSALSHAAVVGANLACPSSSTPAAAPATCAPATSSASTATPVWCRCSNAPDPRAARLVAH